MKSSAKNKFVLRKNSREKFVRFFVAFALLKKSPSFDESGKLIEKTKDAPPDFGRIRCPRCRWRPTAASLWYCSDDFTAPPFHVGCGTGWNTFDTRGRCPGCQYQWRWTDCLRCGGRSKHEAWYENETR